MGREREFPGIFLKRESPQEKHRKEFNKIQVPANIIQQIKAIKKRGCNCG